MGKSQKLYKGDKRLNSVRNILFLSWKQDVVFKRKGGKEHETNEPFVSESADVPEDEEPDPYGVLTGA